MAAKRIHIFKTGTFQPMRGSKVTFSDDDLKQIAESYDPAHHEAPCVLGHPQNDDPAYGWVKGVEFQDGNLFATIDDLNEGFEQAVKDKAFNKVSACFSKSDDGYMLRHVGFLGATPPAVKGLQPIEFSALDQGNQVFEFASDDFADAKWSMRWAFQAVRLLFGGLRDQTIEAQGLDAADRAFPPHALDDIDRAVIELDRPVGTEASHGFSQNPDADNQAPGISTDPEDESKEDVMTPEELTKKEAALEKMRVELDAQRKKDEADRAAFSEQCARNEAETLVDTLVHDGKVLPAEKPGLVSFMAGLNGAETLAFSEGGEEQTARAFMAGFLKGLPKRVEFSEQTGENPGDRHDFSESGNVANAITAHVKKAADEGRVITPAQAAAELNMEA